MATGYGGSVFIHEYVTGGGLAGQALPPSWAAEGGAMRRALAADFAAAGLRVTMTLDARLPDEPGPWRTVRVGPGEERDRVMGLAAAADRTLVVAPETGCLQGERAVWLELVHARSLGPDVVESMLGGDKLRLAGLLEEAGVPTPPTLEVASGDPLPRSASYPAVLKPRYGAGALHTWLVASANDDPGRAGPSTFVLQPYLAGEPVSGSYFVGPDGRARLVGFARQRVAIEGGRFAYLGGELPIALPGADALFRRALATAPGLRGWIGVDAIREARSGRLTVLEINPRPTTSLVGFRALLPPGALARAWLGLFEGGPVEEELAAVAASAPIRFDADGTIRALDP